MTTIAANGQLPASYLLPQTRTRSAEQTEQASSTAPDPATRVNLGQSSEPTDSLTYSRQRLVANAQAQYAWESETPSRLKNLMLAQLSPGSGATRFQGLGAELLEQLAQNGGKAISQSVFAYDGGVRPDAGVLKLQRNGLLANPSDSVTFSLKTASGTTVQLSLASNADGLAISAEVLDGKLSADELAGLGALADSLQSAIDGLTQVPPKLQLGALTRLDPALFGSLQLTARLQTPDGDQRLDLRLDDATRSLDLQGPNGKLALNLDASQTGLVGNTAQRQSAVSHYLTQFDAAQQRGKGNQQLMSLFKDAFVQLNHADDSRSSSASDLSRKDRSLLSGLADFSASISEPQRYTNPMRPLETDSFSFSASQTTRLDGAGSLNSNVQQEQQSTLKASYHQGLNPLVTLALGSDKQSQNYRYVEIDDQSSSSTRMAYRKGKLVEASATQHASQNQRVRTYNDGELTEDVRTPASVTRSRNLLNLINSVFEQERLALRDHRASILETQLQAHRNLWQLHSNPSQIAP